MSSGRRPSPVGKTRRTRRRLATRLLTTRQRSCRDAALVSARSMPAGFGTGRTGGAKARVGVRGQESESRPDVVGTILDEGTSFGSGTAAGSLVVAGRVAPSRAANSLRRAQKVGSFESNDGLRRTFAELQRPERRNAFGPFARCASSLKVPQAPPPRRGWIANQAARSDRHARARRSGARSPRHRFRLGWRLGPIHFGRFSTVASPSTPRGWPDGPRGWRRDEPTGRGLRLEGLYVIDAAAFPAAVGSNSSATIAAIAEYKVAKFIER